MYKIFKDNALLTMVGTPAWVVKQENGAFALCQEADAQGIVVEGTVYHIQGKPEIENAESIVMEPCDDGLYASNVNALLFNPADLKYAEQFRKAVQLFAASLDETSAMEIATVYDPYVVGKTYKADEYFTYGQNEVGDPQLYKVIQEHTSQADWEPDKTASLYTPVGLNDEGYPVWSQPTGAHDAYDKGDIVDYNGTLYVSLIDGNTYSPEAYPTGWEVYAEG